MEIRLRIVSRKTAKRRVERRLSSRIWCWYFRRFVAYEGHLIYSGVSIASARYDSSISIISRSNYITRPSERRFVYICMDSYIQYLIIPIILKM